jgi:hypothetical protein
MVYNYIQKEGGLSIGSMYPLKEGMVKDNKDKSVCKAKVEHYGVSINGGSGDIKPYDESNLLDTIL